MANFALQKYIGKFPLNYSDTPYNVFKAFLRRFRAYINGVNDGTSGSPMAGFIGAVGSFPAVDIGPIWMDATGASRWMVWNKSGGEYAQLEHKFGDATNTITLNQPLDGITASRFFRMPEITSIPSGGAQVLYTADAFVPRATIILSGTAPTIQWTATGVDQYDGSSSDNYILRLTGNTTIGTSGSANGQIKTVVIENNATSYTVTWPAAWKWPGGSAPTQPVGSAGIDAVGTYRFVKINNVIYGKLNNQTVTPPVPTIPTGGTSNIPFDYGFAPVNRQKFPY